MGILKLKIVSIFYTVFVALALYSCSDSKDDNLPKVLESRLSINEPTVSCRVNSFSFKNMFFDELKNTPFTFEPSFTERINLSYNIGNNKISQVSGGLANISVPGSGSQYPFVWSNNVLDIVEYDGNSITVNSNQLYSKRFVIVNNKLVSQLTIYNQSLYFGNAPLPFRAHSHGTCTQLHSG